MREISKAFGANLALSRVDVELSAGEVLGIVGENGAGKSTLVKALAGAHAVDAGTMEIDGRPVQFRSPADSIAAGVAVIYQELTIVPELSVAENVFLGTVPTHGRLPLVNRRRMQAEATRLLRGLGLEINPRQRAGSLSPGYQQMVEIARAINRRAKIVLMDEPTSYLSEHEVGRLYEFIARLKAQQLGIIYISHHLEEIFQVCDRVLVLRDGKTVAVKPIADWTSRSLVEAMVNRSIEQFYPYEPRRRGDVVLSVRHATVPPRLQDVSFDLHRGEILGIAGVVGSGRSELLKAIFGAHPLRGGRLEWNGRPFQPRGPSDAIRHGMVMVPEDRKAEGLMPDASIENNMAASVLPRIARFGFVQASLKRQLSLAGIRQFSVACRGPLSAVRTLSGGNQQKVIFARANAAEPRLYLLDEPTRGVDVGAKVEVYKQIMAFAAAGCAILLVSSELPELLGLADRVLVLNGGRVVGDLSRAAATHERVLHLSTGETVPDEVVHLTDAPAGDTLNRLYQP
ncbi:MAG TPA: sugar ABC transporter ATP-binding protein [Chthoniobacterales bacterium]